MARTDAKIDRLATIVAANDKLLKALITLLAIKDPDLMHELMVMFGGEVRAGDAVGAQVKDEIKMISALVDAEMGQTEIDLPPRLS